MVQRSKTAIQKARALRAEQMERLNRYQDLLAQVFTIQENKTKLDVSLGAALRELEELGEKPTAICKEVGIKQSEMKRALTAFDESTNAQEDGESVTEEERGETADESNT